jgi:hypothetical protein
MAFVDKNFISKNETKYVIIRSENPGYVLKTTLESLIYRYHETNVRRRIKTAGIT